MKPVILILLSLAFAVDPVYTHAQTGTDGMHSFIVSVWPKGDNSPRLPRKKKQDTALQAAIANAIFSGRMQAYADSNFTRVIPASQISKIVYMTEARDELVYEEANGDEIQTLTSEEFDFYALTEYKVLAKGTTSMQLIGIGLYRQKNKKIIEKAKKANVQGFSPIEVLFWVKYKDMKPIIDQYNATHPNNKFIPRKKEDNGNLRTVSLNSDGNGKQDTSLLAEILAGVRARKIIAYADTGFKKIMTVTAINEIVNAKSFTDTVYYEHTPNGDEVIMFISVDFAFFAITDYHLLVRDLPQVQLVGLGIDRRSVVPRHDKRYGDPEPFPATQTLFWVKYSQVKAIVDKYNAAHRNDQLTLRSQK